MLETITRENNEIFKDCSVAEKDEKQKKESPKATKPVRIRVDIAEAIEAIAPIYGQTPPEFISNALKKVLRDLQKEAPDKLKEKIKDIE